MGFAQNLKYIKETENLTNYRLAKLFGCSQSSLINWLENGIIPHTKTRQKIADHFGITLAELDGEELPVLPEDGAKKAPATEGEGEKDALIKAVGEITDKDTALAVFDELSKKMRELM